MLSKDAINKIAIGIVNQSVLDSVHSGFWAIPMESSNPPSPTRMCTDQVEENEDFDVQDNGDDTIIDISCPDELR